MCIRDRNFTVTKKSDEDAATVFDFVGDTNFNHLITTMAALCTMLMEPEGLAGQKHLRLLHLIFGPTEKWPLRVTAALQVSLLLGIAVLWRKFVGSSASFRQDPLACSPPCYRRSFFASGTALLRYGPMSPTPKSIPCRRQHLFRLGPIGISHYSFYAARDDLHTGRVAVFATLTNHGVTPRVANTLCEGNEHDIQGHGRAVAPRIVRSRGVQQP